MSSPEPPGAHEDASLALTADFQQTAQVVFAAGDGDDDTLALVVHLAVDTIEGCDFAGISVIEGGAVITPVCTDPVVAEIDALQNEADEGPCRDAIAEQAVCYAVDLAVDPRWPRFGPEAAARGMRSLLALPMSSDAPLGSLGLYARYPEAFGVVDRARGLLLAAVATVALAAARAHEDEERRAANLHAALATREMIGQAQGILMERERISADEAFDVLRRASQHLNVKLREVALALVETGERPDTGPQPRGQVPR